MSYYAPTSPRAYLADALRASAARDVALVLGGTAFITLAAFVTIPLPFTPVPIALSTFAVLLTGASLGAARGALSAGLYLLIGALGAPVFSDGQSGIMLPTFGYIVGYVLAAAIAGGLARRRADRRAAATLLLGALGAVSLYLCGVPWLALSLGIDLGQAVVLGVAPFLIGDALKVAVLAALLPAAWRVVGAGAPGQDRKGR